MNSQLKERVGKQSQNIFPIESNFTITPQKSRSISAYKSCTNSVHSDNNTSFCHEYRNTNNASSKRRTIEITNRRKIYENLTLNAKSSTYQSPTSYDDTTNNNYDGNSNYSLTGIYNSQTKSAAQEEQEEQQNLIIRPSHRFKYLVADLHALRDFRLQHVNECFGNLHRYKLQHLQQQQANIQVKDTPHYSYDYPTGSSATHKELSDKQREPDSQSSDNYSIRKSSSSSSNTLMSTTAPYQYKQRELREQLLKSASENVPNDQQVTKKPGLYQKAKELGFNSSLALSYQPMY